jgi:hypothetical protein
MILSNVKHLHVAAAVMFTRCNYRVCKAANIILHGMVLTWSK